MSKNVPFSKWQPIGVCDAAGSGKRKAKIFTRADFDKIATFDLNRQNWQGHSGMQTLILRYARDVAKMSTLTRDMKNPRVCHVKLVGMQMQLKETPWLNQASYDGQVQLFQVEFLDQPSKQSAWWLWVLLLLLLIALLAVIALFVQSSFNTSPKTTFCHMQSVNYEQHLDQAHQELDQVFSKSLLANRFGNFFDDFSTSNQTSEQKLLGRYRQLLENPQISAQHVPKSTACLKVLCQQDNRLCL